MAGDCIVAGATGSELRFTSRERACRVKHRKRGAVTGTGGGKRKVLHEERNRLSLARPGRQPATRPLEGEWRLERLGGALPPLGRARKEVRGERGRTRFGPFPGVPFRIEERGDRFALVYRRPFSMLVDEVREGPDGSWLGEATLAGRAFGRFRMTRVP